MLAKLPRLAPAALILLSCGGQPPTRADDAARAQADLATDTAQARLWREAAPTASALDVRALHTDSAVLPAAPVVIPERPQQQRPGQPFDASVQSAIAFVEAPAIDPPFVGTARVAAVDGEFLTLDLGQAGTLRIHVKLAGAPLRAQAGEQANVLFGHADEPTTAADRLVVRLPQDDLLYALVGGDGPVTVSLAPFRLTAQQTDSSADNTMPVRVSVGGETRVLRHGEVAAFAESGLTVQVLASIAVQGERANVLPGEPYRLQILGWRTRPQR